MWEASRSLEDADAGPEHPFTYRDGGALLGMARATGSSDPRGHQGEETMNIYAVSTTDVWHDFIEIAPAS